MERPVTEILAEMRRKGVTLWSEDGQLRYRAPKGALTTEEVARLRASKCELVAFLQHATRARCAHAPLAYTQLARWQTYRTGERRPMRTVGAALRLRGRLDREALRKALAGIVQRQDALRTTIVVVDGVPVQRVAASVEDRLAVHDLTALADDLQQPEVDRIALQIMSGTVDLATGPLFEAQLIELRSCEHVLIVAMEHLIADGYSLGILMREPLAAYGQVLRGEVISLPTIAMQFAEYAEAQMLARQSWQRDHSRYWVERLAGCQRVRFAPDSGSRNAASGWGTVSVTLDAATKARLRECCRKHRTTLVMGALTAYAALVLRWCSVPELIVQCLSDCRTSAAIENTIGFFASPLYLRVALRPQDSFADLMKRVTAEYGQAYEHADCSLFESQTPRPGFTRNSSFNWVMQGLPGNDPVERSRHALECSAVPLAHTIMQELRLDQEPGMLFYDTDAAVTGIVHFPLDRFAVRTMERFADDFLRFATALLDDPGMRVQDVMLS